MSRQPFTSTRRARKPTGTTTRPPRTSKGISRGLRRGKKTSRPRWLRWAAVLLLLSSAVLAWAIWPFWQMAGQFGAGDIHQPSRLYAHPVTLEVGESRALAELTRDLDSQGYVRVGSSGSSEMAAGSYRLGSAWVEIHRRTFPSPQGLVGGNRLRVGFAGGRIRSLHIEGRATSDAWLDPPLIASFYGPDLRERRPFESVQRDLPEDLILSVLAIEDSGFLSHVGISLTGALRAAWTNLARKEVRQGGSTLTQQLVKNLFLTHERTWTRKVREALLALFIEMRYDKETIFRAYLNEIYWGRSGAVDLMGVGAASWAYFSKEPSQLSLAECALLAGMIHSPASYSPFKHEKQAKERRNRVLERLAQLRWVEQSRLEDAARQGVEPRQGPLIARQAPYFADAMAAEARQRFGIKDLRDQGYVLVSTLSHGDQKAAEKAVSQGLPEVEKEWEKVGKPEGLQAALVSIDPKTGGILAYVGGREYAASQFDRVAHARRQPGSAFKPVVYAAALAGRMATPATILRDAPYQVTYDGRSWSPKNSNGQYQGDVSLRQALERSLNVPTAKLALRTRLPPIIDLAHAMGIEARIKPFPALALGSMAVTPLEMAAVYSTLASGGVRRPMHGLDAVLDGGGEPVAGKKLAAPQRVLDENVAFLVTHVLQGVLDRGTARGARRQGVTDTLAGKTGTTNSRRDSWFGGYSADRATVVWVGYDDASKTSLSGARAALPLWARFIRGARPPAGFESIGKPSGVAQHDIDPQSGGLAIRGCPQVASEYFLSDFPPAPCSLHGGGGRPGPRLKKAEARAPKVPEKENKFGDWIKMVRGKKTGQE